MLTTILNVLLVLIIAAVLYSVYRNGLQLENMENRSHEEDEEHEGMGHEPMGSYQYN